MKRSWKVALLMGAVAGAVMPRIALGDIFGMDIPILTQILANSISQLAELRAILKTGGEEFGLLQSINQGINDSLAMAQTMGIHVDPGLYGQVSSVNQGAMLVSQVYGPVPDSPLAPSERDTDESVAEALSMHNDLYAYTAQLDQVGETIKNYSHAVSPGGAAKLTAESLGVMIHVMNEQMRASSEGLKLQAQTLAVENQKEKASTQEYLQEAKILSDQMADQDLSFEVPRF